MNKAANNTHECDWTRERINERDWTRERERPWRACAPETFIDPSSIAVSSAAVNETFGSFLASLEAAADGYDVRRGFVNAFVRTFARSLVRPLNLLHDRPKAIRST